MTDDYDLSSVHKNESKAMETTDKHKCFRVGDWVSISINPSPHYQFFDEGVVKRRKGEPPLKKDLHAIFGKPNSYYDRLEKFYNTFLYMVKHIEGIVDWCYHLEFSTKSQLLHLHGYGKVSNVHLFYHTLGYYTNEGRGTGSYQYYRIEVDTVNDINIWRKYCEKDEDVMVLKMTPQSEYLTKIELSKQLEGKAPRLISKYKFEIV